MEAASIENNAPNQEKKRAKWLLAVKMLLFTALTVAMLGLLGNWLYPGGRTYQLLTDYQTAEKAPDILLIGSSQVYNGFAPVLFDEKTGLVSHMLSTPGQKIGESYYLLRECVDEGKIPGTLMLLVNPGRVSKVTYSNWTVQIVENLPFFSRNRYELMWVSDYTVEDLPDLMLKAYRAREYLMKRIKSLFNPKDSKKTTKLYEGKGYSQNEKGYDLSSIALTNIVNFSKGGVSDESYAFLEKIVALCKENNIRLILLSIPRVPGEIIDTNYSNERTYQAFYDYMKEYADTNELLYWDLNYLRSDVISYNASNFSSHSHVNTSLALPITELLAEMVNKLNDGTLVLSDYLFDTYEEFLIAHPGLQGVYISSLKQNNDNSYYCKIHPVAEHPEEYEWRLLSKYEQDDEYKLMQDWNQDTIFKLTLLPSHEHEYTYLEVRKVGTEEILQVFKKTYTK